jgi:hypothetical protein
MQVVLKMQFFVPPPPHQGERLDASGYEGLKWGEVQVINVSVYDDIHHIHKNAPV